MLRSKQHAKANKGSPPPPPPPSQSPSDQHQQPHRNPSPRAAYQPHRRLPSISTRPRPKMTAGGNISSSPAMLSGLANVTNVEESDPETPSSQSTLKLSTDQTTSPSTGLPSSSPEPDDTDTIPHVHGDIVRSVHFYRPPRYGSPPRSVVAHANGTGVKNFGTAPIKVTLRDIRNKEHRFHLGLHSFKPLRHLTPIEYPLDLEDPTVAASIATSVSDLIKRHVTSPNKITVFSTEILKASNSMGFPTPKIAHPLQIDQTPSSALLCAERSLPPNIYSQISSGKLSMRIINVYRPLLPADQKISDHPLYVSESHSILDEDLVSVEHIHADDVGATYAVKHAEGQRFWYWSDMEPTEGFIIQVYDSMFGCDNYGEERSIRAATGFFKLMPQGYDEGWDAEWLVARALVLA
ncbi:hypothetical protein TWF481_010915 [Arthrobotrys musiformis]|uniref:Uncharacterized protein n=1 Tax=Arthrobotrys musiformis TaxID=47236 RepID=A0AAV9W2W0_9PEZI